MPWVGRGHERKHQAQSGGRGEQEENVTRPFIMVYVGRNM